MLSSGNLILEIGAKKLISSLEPLPKFSVSETQVSQRFMEDMVILYSKLVRKNVQAEDPNAMNWRYNHGT